MEQDKKINLKEIIKDFISELISSFPEDLNLYKVNLFISEDLSEEDLMTYVTKILYPVKEKILKKDVDVYKDFINVLIFYNLIDSVSEKYFINLWNNRLKDSMDTIWIWLECFISILEKI